VLVDGLAAPAMPHPLSTVGSMSPAPFYTALCFGGWSVCFFPVFLADSPSAACPCRVCGRLHVITHSQCQGGSATKCNSQLSSFSLERKAYRCRSAVQRRIEVSERRTHARPFHQCSRKKDPHPFPWLGRCVTRRAAPPKHLAFDSHARSTSIPLFPLGGTPTVYSAE
jgi:hypothetical protein